MYITINNLYPNVIPPQPKSGCGYWKLEIHSYISKDYVDKVNRDMACIGHVQAFDKPKPHLLIYPHSKCFIPFGFGINSNEIGRKLTIEPNLQFCVRNNLLSMGNISIVGKNEYKDQELGIYVYNPTGSDVIIENNIIVAELTCSPVEGMFTSVSEKST